MAARENGIVKSFNNVRGYGFITRIGTSEDVFVHFRNIRGKGYRSLGEGQRVEFELRDTDKGLHAHDVARLD